MKTKRHLHPAARATFHSSHAGAFFTIGSSSTRVLRLQGKPERVDRFEHLGYEQWRYGDDTLEITLRTKRVSKWKNFGRRLKTGIRIGPHTTDSVTFTVGSSRDDVARLQGTPDAIERHERWGLETWHFGDAFVEIAIRGGVRSWKNVRNALKAEMIPGAQATRRSRFSVGSPRDDVVRLQGTPDWIQNFEPLGYQIWHYGDATVTISTADERVREWSNEARRLKTSKSDKRSSNETALKRARDFRAHASHHENSAQRIRWHGRDLSVEGASMYYRGRLHIDPIRGAIYLRDLEESPSLDEVLHWDDYEAEIRIIRRLKRQLAL